jgi:hypothetical protein
MGRAKLKAFLANSRARSRKLSIAFVLLVVVTAGATRTLGSGGDGCDEMNCGWNWFFDSNLLLSAEDTPLYVSQRKLYGRPTGQPASAKDVQTVNLEEWSAYFGNAIAQPLLSDLIYHMPLAEVLDLVAAAEGKNPSLTADRYLMNEAFVKYGRRTRVLRSLEYLALAKRVEPIATQERGYRWGVESPAAVDPAGVEELIKIAESRVSRADKFLAQRYRFQALRLMYYSGQYERAQQYYERYKGAFTEENSPKYRFVDIAAGSYYKEQKYGKANYLYSRVFDKFAPLRWSAQFSFHPMEDQDWKETLALAHNTHEREVLWQLLGIYADGVAAIDEIYKMNPKSKLLPYLLVREVNRADRAWTGNQDRFINGVGPGNGPRPEAVVVGISRVATIRAIADAGKADKPYLWRLAAGHLLTMTGDSRTAEKYLDLAEKSIPNDSDIRAQLRLSRLFARVRAIQTIDKAVEPYLAQEHEWLKSVSTSKARNLHTWTLKHLSEVYLKDGDSVRALMLTDSPEAQNYQSVSGVDGILAFVRTPSNEFDRFLVSNYPYSVEDLQELRALNILYAGNLADAVEAFKLAEGPSRQLLNADPFTSRIRDCHDCDAAIPHTEYTKRAFAERMLALSRTAQGHGEGAAAASFELANGFYNMSYFGNGRVIYRTRNDNFHPYGPVTTAMELAEKYYVQASTLSSSKELKAKAVFMAAKTEQNLFKQRPEKYFGMLKDSYADTMYYQEIIRECVRFKSYLGL